MKVIGLTGGTGSGKSMISDFLRRNHVGVIDADKIGHEIIARGAPAYDEIVTHFGEGILDEEKNIIRKQLGDIVFQNKEKLVFLNRCTHKYISQEINHRIMAYKEDGKVHAIVIDAPLLMEARLDKICDRIWVVFAKEDVRKQRIMLRDGITEEMALARMANQRPWSAYREVADEVLDNSEDIDHLEAQLLRMLEKINSYG